MAARTDGIDAVEDLHARSWPGPGAETIIGVFQAEHLLASWLVVGQGGTWAVASCSDGSVSRTLPSLMDALNLICPVTTTEP